MTSRFSRRTLLRAGLAASVVASGRRTVRAVSPGGKLRTAHVGVGGMGAADLASIASHPAVEVAALCDVDATRLEAARAKHPAAKTFRDYRQMLAELSEKVDAVVVSTPDHTHAPAALAALERAKPVYCQKPLTHQVAEARTLRELAAAKGVPTQMGIQVHAAAPYRRAVRIVQSGALGKVREVHAWSNKNWGYDGGPFAGIHTVPETLDWNLWLGTAAERPFVPGVFHPSQWRKLIDFGTGTLGDMGVHIFDTPYAALELTAPRWVQTSCRPPTGLGHPEKNRVEYEFPGTKYTTATLRWKWYDGAFAPPRPEDLGLPAGFQVPGQGSLFVGEEGTLLLPHVAEAQLFPEAKYRDFVRPEVESGNHYHEWVDTCLGRGRTSADFGYAGPLTEALLLGVVANRFPDTRLNWDAAQLRVTNLSDANALLRRPYREGF